MTYATSFELNKVEIETIPGETWDISKIIAEINVYEDIFNSTISADIFVDDANNQIKNFPITGHEWLRIEFKTPGKSPIKLHLRIYKISSRELEKERRQFYVIHCSDQAQFANGQHMVSKAYKNLTISDIAQNVQREYLGTDFFKIEATKNLFHIIPAYWTPIKTLNFLASRANSAQYKGANYLYFQTADGFNFVSLENLMDTDPKIKYIFQPANIRDQSVVDGYKPHTIESDEVAIQSYKFVSNFDTMENLTNGMYGSSLLWQDIRTKTFGEETFDYATSYDDYKHVEPNSVADGSSRLWTSASDFQSIYGVRRHFPIGQPEQANNVKEWLIQRISQLQQIQNIRLVATVPGDSDRRVGHIVEITLPSPEPLIENQLQLDKYYTGRYLVTGLKHTINRQQYTTVLDLAKDSVHTALP